MLKKTEYYKYTFFYPGAIVLETAEKNYDQYVDISSLKIDKYCVGLKIEKVEVITDDNGKQYFSKENEKVAIYYFGRLLSVEDVKREKGEDSILYKNAVNNHYDGVVISASGWASAYFKDRGSIVMTIDENGVAHSNNSENSED